MPHGSAWNTGSPFLTFHPAADNMEGWHRRADDAAAQVALMLAGIATIVVLHHGAS